MIELGAAITAVVLLLIILVIYEVWKRASKKANPVINLKTTGTAKQSQKIKPDNTPGFQTELKSKPPGVSALNAEPRNEHSVEIQTDEPVVDTVASIAPQAKETVIPESENKYKNLPQDSMLRRHYLTHLLAMIKSLKSPRPTDSALSRHYDAMVIAEMEQCLSDEAAMEQLISHYEEHKKILAQKSRKPEAIPEPLIEPIKAGINQEKPSLPEDSMLRRHYLTHLGALVESRMPPRPTDSTLRRHYDSMIENEVENLL